MDGLEIFDTYLQRWDLQIAGRPVATHTSDLLPVWHQDQPAMLKISRNQDELRGGQIMQWWDGLGAARLFASDPQTGALLMERATGKKHLLHMALNGEDDIATACICQAVQQLHAKRSVPPANSVHPLAQMFNALESLAPSQGGTMLECLGIARSLLQEHRDPVFLHGDAHHSNILDFEQRGWLAIDPKPFVGDRCYDYVNLLCNPDLENRTNPARFVRQLTVVIHMTGLELPRLLKWTMAQAALSAAWFLEDGMQNKANEQLAVATLARELMRE